MAKIRIFHRSDSGEEIMMVDVSLHYGTALVKEGAVFFKGGKIIRTSSIKGNIDR